MDELNDEILRLEHSVWDALVTGDADADAALLADDFLGVYPTGFGSKDEHVAQLANGATVATYEISESTVRSLAVGVALLTYQANYQRSAGASVEQMYVTSIWSRNDGEWTNVFSQDTPASGKVVP